MAVQLSFSAQKRRNIFECLLGADELQHFVREIEPVDFGQKGFCPRIISVADDDNLFGRIKVLIDGTEHVRETKRLVFHHIIVRAQDLFGAGAIIVLAGNVV